MAEARIVVVEDLEDPAATLIVEALSEALAHRARARLVLAGGTTPLATYERLAEQHRRTLDWARVDFYFGDERSVAPEDSASNYAAADARLLRPLSIADSQVRRIHGELPPTEAALAYDRVVARAMRSGSWDLVLLGIGDDGHTASLFPGDEVPEGGSWTIATRSPLAPRDRISMTARALSRSSAILFLAAGPSKASPVRRVLAGDLRLPAARIGATGVPVTWILDREAAAELGDSQSVQSKRT